MIGRLRLKLLSFERLYAISYQVTPLWQRMRVDGKVGGNGQTEVSLGLQLQRAEEMARNREKIDIAVVYTPGMRD